MGINTAQFGQDPRKWAAGMMKAVRDGGQVNETFLFGWLAAALRAGAGGGTCEMPNPSVWSTACECGLAYPHEGQHQCWHCKGTWGG